MNKEVAAIGFEPALEARISVTLAYRVGSFMGDGFNHRENQARATAHILPTPELATVDFQVPKIGHIRNGHWS